MAGAVDAGDMPPETPDVRSACTDPTARRYPRWWGVVLIRLFGLGVAFSGFFAAALLLPRYGLFAVENTPGERLTGFAGAVACGLGLASGPLLIGVVRDDRRWLRASAGIVAATVVVLVGGILLTDS